MVSKKVKKKVFFFLIGKIRHGIGKRVAILDWEWGGDSAPRDGQKIPCSSLYFNSTTVNKIQLSSDSTCSILEM